MEDSLLWWKEELLNRLARFRSVGLRRHAFLDFQFLRFV